MSLGPLLRHYALAAAVADGRVAAVGARWSALLGRDPTGDEPSSLGLGGALATALTGTAVDVRVGPARLRVRGVPFGDSLVLLGTDITELRPATAELGLRFLVVDADGPARDALLRSLAELGHAATPVEADARAVALAATAEHDLMLIAVTPAALDVVRAIRRDERTRRAARLPIASIGPERDEAITAGVDACLVAPLDAAALVELGTAYAQGHLTAPIDFGTFLQRVGGQRAIACEIAALFSRGLATATDDLARAITEGDAKRIAAEAHRVRGALVQVAASRALELAREIERGASDPIACAARLADLRHELRRAAASLTAYAAA